MNEHDNGRRNRRDPVEEFIAGEGPLAAALREMPEFEPPPGMTADFRRMLASLPEAAAAFEPPARLEASVLAEIARQQAASSTRREAVLGELARGADPARALDADLAPATRAWLRERSRQAGGDDRLASKQPSIHGTDTPAAGRDGRRGYRWPAGWWRYAGGGLAAVLALGVGLRMMIEPPPEPESAGTRTEAEARKSTAGAAGHADDAETRARGEVRDESGVSGGLADDAVATPPAPAAVRATQDRQPDRQAQGQGPEKVESRAELPRERADREQAMRERHAPTRAMAPPPPARPAPAPEARASASRTEDSSILKEEALTSTTIENKTEAADADTTTGVDAMAGLQDNHSAPSWRLSDDPVVRLSGLPAGSRWVLLCHPSERAAAEEWLRRGLDQPPKNTGSEAAVRPGVEKIRVEAHDEVAAGSLRLVRDD